MAAAVFLGRKLSPLGERRWANFKANRRGYWSLWLFLALFTATMFSELIANDRPILASYKGEILVPVLVDYPEEKFGGFLAVTDYRDPVISGEIEANGWAIWPPVRYSYASVNKEIPHSAPAKPSWMYDKAERCARYPKGADDTIGIAAVGKALSAVRSPGPVHDNGYFVFAEVGSCGIVEEAQRFEGGVNVFHRIQNGIRVEGQVGVGVGGRIGADGVAPDQGKIGRLPGFAPGKLAAVNVVRVLQVIRDVGRFLGNRSRGQAGETADKE